MKHTDVRPLFADDASVHAPAWGEDGAWVPLHAAIPEVDATGHTSVAPPAPTPTAAESIAEIEQAFRQKLEAMQRALDDERARYARAAQQLEETQARFVRDAEDETIKLALHIAREVMTDDLQVRADFVQRMAHEAMSTMRGAVRVTLRVGPNDAVTLREALRGEHGAQHCDVVEDPALEDGGLVAISEGARFDADVKTRLQVIERQLAEASRQVHHV